MDWSNLFAVSGFFLIGLTIYDFFMTFTCSALSCADDNSTYATYCVLGAVCIGIALILHVENPVILDEEE